MATEKAYFAAGCFWGVQHAFESIPGVLGTAVGYMNGNTENPSYEDVCRGSTMHAEAVEVEFDPALVSFAQMVWVFWHLHDPTQLNRQGPDVGTQYRSGVYTVGDAQAEAARASMAKWEAKTGKRAATEIAPAARFWPAEGYHQHYFAKNPLRAMCHPLPDVKKLLAL